MSRIIKIIYIFIGSISLILGILGIFIPGLPTTPFLLLTAALYIRSSKKLYNSLINNKLLGKYIENYSRNKGISISVKIYSIIIMWIMILISTIFLIHQFWVDIIVISVGIIGTIVMGFVIKTVKTRD